MGHTLDEWRVKVSEILRDEAGRDMAMLQIDSAGLRPAFAEHSTTKPREDVAEYTGAGSRYLDLPDGWMTERSVILSIEHPAHLDPPQYLCDTSWRLRRSLADVTVEQIYLDRVPVAGQYLRVTYLARWPFPDDDATTDRLSDDEFEAVSFLAASYCCLSMSSQASRGRDGALSTDNVPGNGQRPQGLTAIADRLREQWSAVALGSWWVA